MDLERKLFNLVLELHKQLFYHSMINELPKAFFLERKTTLENIERNFSISANLLKKQISEEKHIEGDILKSREDFSKFYIHIHSNPSLLQALKKDIDALHKKTADICKEIKEEEELLKNISQSLTFCLEKISDLADELHNKYSSSHFEYLMTLDKAIILLKDCFGIITKVWDMEKQIEKEETTIGELFKNLQGRGVNPTTPLFNTEGKDQRALLENIAKLEYEVELNERRYS